MLVQLLVRFWAICQMMAGDSILGWLHDLEHRVHDKE